MGGGLELALHCHYRTLSAGVPAIALPEVFLGLVPGWGGSQLLPNLIGADQAVTVIVENAITRTGCSRGQQALDLGIADVLFEPADFLEQSLAWAAAVVRGEVTVERPEVDRGAAWDAGAGPGQGDRRRKGARGGPGAVQGARADRAGPHARRTTTASRPSDEALAELAMGEELRAGLYAFDLVQRRAKRPAGVPDKSLARPSPRSASSAPG